VLASDLGRFYRARDEQQIAAAWKPAFADLDAVQRAATRAGGRMALAIFPSVLQVDGALRAATVARLTSSYRYRGLSMADIDPDLPNAQLREYARSRGIPLADLTPIFVAESAAAGEALYKRSDNHWTPRGNRVAARALVPFLQPLVCAAR
jgi:2-oxoglutarate dehydrogenase complex dehydrogenase (E1) component-like enzyme